MAREEQPTGEILLYQTEDGRTRIECRFEAYTLRSDRGTAFGQWGTVRHGARRLGYDGPWRTHHASAPQGMHTLAGFFYPLRGAEQGRGA